MLRRLQTVSHKNIDAMYTADVAMKRGMAVQKNYANKEAIVPTSQVGLYFVDKDPAITGLLSVQGEISDYNTSLENIKAGDAVLLEAMVQGEVYGTDQVVTTGLSVGNYLEAETTGDNSCMLKKSSSTTNMVYGGTYNDNGHTLYIVQIVQ